jgi:hypothetical protein
MYPHHIKGCLLARATNGIMKMCEDFLIPKVISSIHMASSVTVLLCTLSERITQSPIIRPRDNDKLRLRRYQLSILVPREITSSTQFAIFNLISEPSNKFQSLQNLLFYNYVLESLPALGISYFSLLLPAGFLLSFRDE